MEKNCPKCNIIKSVDDFYKCKNAKDGRYNICKICELERKKIYYQENKEKRYAYERNKYHSDETVRIKKLLRRRFLAALKTQSTEKCKSIIELSGCDLDFFKKWIEYQYKLITNTETIDWEDFKQNYHIDHLIPCSSFNLTDIEEQKKCFHWKNIQILTKENNLKKSNTIISQELIDKHNKKINNFLKINI
jgi:hypothetical protein